MGPNDPMGSSGPREQIREIRVQREGREVGENMAKKAPKGSEHFLVASDTRQAGLEGSYGQRAAGARWSCVDVVGGGALRPSLTWEQCRPAGWLYGES